MLVTRFQQASKKNFSFWDFCFQLYAQMIEIPRLRSGPPLSLRHAHLIEISLFLPFPTSFSSVPPTRQELLFCLCAGCSWAGKGGFGKSGSAVIMVDRLVCRFVRRIVL